MSQTASAALRLRCFTVCAGGSKPWKDPTPKQNRYHSPKPSISTVTGTPTGSSTLGFGKIKKDPQWQCVENCGACCKLDKGPDFPSPEEIFEDPSDIEKFKSLIGHDGWCIHFEKATRKCSIYADRPYFCRVEPDVFLELYGIEKKKFNREACSCCIDTIKAIYGSKSEELDNFNQGIWDTNAKSPAEQGS